MHVLDSWMLHAVSWCIMMCLLYYSARLVHAWLQRNMYTCPSLVCIDINMGCVWEGEHVGWTASVLQRLAKGYVGAPSIQHPGRTPSIACAHCGGQ
jgi:hypothetical protein